MEINPEEIELESIGKLFEFERLSRDIDSIDDIKVLRNLAKSCLKLYYKQQEVIAHL